MAFRRGQRQRLRLVNMMIAPPAGMDIVLRKDTAVLQWRPLAKDGATLPAAQQKLRPARLRPTIGETYDFEVMIEGAGEFALDVKFPPNAPFPGVTLPIRVR